MFRRDLMAHVGQSDEDTVALFDEGGYTACLKIQTNLFYSQWIGNRAR